MVQSIIERMCQTDKLNKDYLASAMLSAAAATIGNSQRVHIMGTWLTAPMFYMALVGMPGAGKTPPLEKAFAPVKDFDQDVIMKYERDLAEYKNQLKTSQTKLKKPVARLRIVNDSTPEATINAHYKQIRGILIHSDELMGFFNSINRYNNGQFLEQLLSAWSGQRIVVTRKTTDEILSIDFPNINLVGTMQTKRCPELFNDKYEKMGFLDRMLFCYPEDLPIDDWNPQDLTRASDNGAAADWKKILSALNDVQIGAVTREFDSKAFEVLCSWRNKIKDEVSASENREFVSSRQLKRPTMVVRTALTLQAMRDAAEDMPFTEPVSLWAVESAIEINDYFEACYEALLKFVKQNTNESTTKPSYIQALNGMPSEFTYRDFQKELEKYSTSTGAGAVLKRMVKNGLIVNTDRGRYAKLGNIQP